MNILDKETWKTEMLSWFNNKNQPGIINISSSLKDTKTLGKGLTDQKYLDFVCDELTFKGYIDKAFGNLDDGTYLEVKTRCFENLDEIRNRDFSNSYLYKIETINHYGFTLYMIRFTMPT